MTERQLLTVSFAASIGLGVFLVGVSYALVFLRTLIWQLS